MNGWLGEVQGLQISLDAAVSKMASLRRTTGASERKILLGMPIIERA
jgi:hypothetical protein